MNAESSPEKQRGVDTDNVEPNIPERDEFDTTDEEHDSYESESTSSKTDDESAPQRRRVFLQQRVTPHKVGETLPPQPPPPAPEVNTAVSQAVSMKTRTNCM